MEEKNLIEENRLANLRHYLYITDLLQIISYFKCEKINIFFEKEVVWREVNVTETNLGIEQVNIQLFTGGNNEFIEGAKSILREVRNAERTNETVPHAMRINSLLRHKIKQQQRESDFEKLLHAKYRLQSIPLEGDIVARFEDITGFAVYEAGRISKIYERYFKWHPILQQWVNFLTNYGPGIQQSKDELQMDTLTQDVSHDYDPSQKMNEILSCLSGKWLGKYQIMSPENFNQLVSYCHATLMTGKVPKKITPIPATPASNEFIRFTFYSIYKEYKSIFPKSRAVWIDLLHACFKQFDSQSKTTTDKNFKSASNYSALAKQCLEKKE